VSAVGQELYFASVHCVDKVVVLEVKRDEVLIQFPDGQKVWEFISALYEQPDDAEEAHQEAVASVARHTKAPTAQQVRALPVPAPKPRDDGKTTA